MILTYVRTPCSHNKTPQTGKSQLGSTHSLAPALPTEFEIQAKRLGLTPETYVSAQVRIGWCSAIPTSCRSAVSMEWANCATAGR
jgi:hypothetical protein